MKLDEKKIRFMQEGLSVELIQMLMEEWGCGEEEALETFYNSGKAKNTIRYMVEKNGRAFSFFETLAL